MKRIKRSWKQMVALLLILVLGGAVGTAIAWQGALLGLLGGGRDFLLFYLPAYLGLLASFFLQIILHEAGHLVFGLLSGYRLTSFRVGSLMLIKQQGRWTLRRLRIPGTGGQCLMAPPPMVDGRFPTVLYNLGGGLMNLASAALLLGLRSIRGMNPHLSLFLFVAALMGLFIGLSNLIPIKTRLISNDGHNALALNKNPLALRALWLQLTINARLADGQRLKDMPEDWFALPEEGLQDNLTAALAVIAANRLMDEKRFQEADAMMARLLSQPGSMAGLHRHMLACDRIYLELVGQNRDSVLANLDSPEVAKTMKAMKGYPSVLRTRFARALLRDGDREQAEQMKMQFDRVAPKHPYPADIQSEAELMDRAEAAWLQQEQEEQADLPAGKG